MKIDWKILGKLLTLLWLGFFIVETNYISFLVGSETYWDSAVEQVQARCDYQVYQLNLDKLRIVDNCVDWIELTTNITQMMMCMDQEFYGQSCQTFNGTGWYE